MANYQLVKLEHKSKFITSSFALMIEATSEISEFVTRGRDNTVIIFRLKKSEYKVGKKGVHTQIIFNCFSDFRIIRENHPDFSKFNTMLNKKNI